MSRMKDVNRLADRALDFGHHLVGWTCIAVSVAGMGFLGLSAADVLTRYYRTKNAAKLQQQQQQVQE
eukprot:6209912-Pleurochrysis_carterae.AAC.2